MLKESIECSERTTFSRHCRNAYFLLLHIFLLLLLPLFQLGPKDANANVVQKYWRLYFGKEIIHILLMLSDAPLGFTSPWIGGWTHFVKIFREVKSFAAASSSGPWRPGLAAFWRGTSAEGRRSPSPSLGQGWTSGPSVLRRTST